jgi:hypothetical protein
VLSLSLARFAHWTMAKLSTRRLKQKAEEGAQMIVRDRLAPIVEDETSPYNGEYPPLLSRDGLPCTLTLLGADSETAKRMDRQRQATAQNRVTLAFMGTKKKQESSIFTPDDIAEQADYDLNRVTALTVGWYGFEDDNDEPVPFTAEDVRFLYVQDPDIREQAISFIGDRARFFARSSTPSAPTSSTSSEAPVVAPETPALAIS